MHDLWIGKRSVTDAGLAHLRNLTSLQDLRFFYTPVSGAGLAHLEGLSLLESLDLSSTNVTGPGVPELRRALPSLKVIW